MKSLSWNEIKDRAYKFKNQWKEARSERSQSQSFWIDFFNIFGENIRRRRGVFEKDIKNLHGNTSYIDLFWKSHILIEHKSKGKNLEKAYGAKNKLDTERQRMEFLFNLYDQYTNPLLYSS